MHAATLTDRQRAAVQAYLRLLHTVRAVLDTGEGTASYPPGAAPPAHTPGGAGPAACAPRPPAVPPSLLADADESLAAAGLTGHESEFFALLRAWCPDVGATDD